MYKLCRILLTFAMGASVLASCGGGGSGGGSPAPAPAPVPPQPTAFTVSGTVTASASQAVDSDTNDPSSPGLSNNDIASAQSIPNPITLGGYINQPGTGSEGRSQVDGDIDDYFRVELLAGQTVTVLVADFVHADADLYLYDPAGNIVDFSIETGEIESIVIPRDGTYLVNVTAFDGATNYILAVGTRAGAAANGFQQRDIVPWQTVVKYRQTGKQKLRSATTPEPAINRHLGLLQRGGADGRARLMELRRLSSQAMETSARLGSAGRKLGAFTSPALVARWQTLLTIKAMRRDPEVEYAEPNYKVRTQATPNDEAYPVQWHYPLIDLPGAWDTTVGSPEVIVAVVDTGILANHPDLAGQLVSGFDFVRDANSAADGDGIDPDPTDTGGSSGVGSSSFHGTHVSGTIAARGNNGIGVAGAAYGVRVMPVRALGADGSGTSYDVAQAIRFAAGLANDSGTVPAQRADVINLSLGGGGFSQAEQALFEEVRAAGVVVVAAAGNEASSQPSYPAAYDGVISVSAVDSQSRLASYSNIGATVDIAAPGGDNSVDLNGDGYPDGVLSTGATSSANGINFAYTFLSGTSMASPHVAAVMALMKSVNPALSPADIDALLARGDLSDDLGAAGRDDQYGQGLVNAQRAVFAALSASGSSPAAEPRLVASASTLNFAGSGTSLDLSLRNGGQGNLRILDINTSQPWLVATAVDVDANKLGLYRITADRTTLAPGVYSADITARSSANDIVVHALIAVGDDSIAGDVGVIYILLYDPEADETVAELGASVSAGRYPFRFDNVPPGQYQLLAGSDADNDLFICDEGEACGAWLTVDQPIMIDLQANRTNLNFPVDYQVAIPNIAAATKNDGSDKPATGVHRQRAPVLRRPASAGTRQ